MQTKNEKGFQFGSSHLTRISLLGHDSQYIHNARHIVLCIIGYIAHATAGAAYRSAAVKVERSGSEERSAVNERSGSERGVTATDAAATNQRNSN